MAYASTADNGPLLPRPLPSNLGSAAKPWEKSSHCRPLTDGRRLIVRELRAPQGYNMTLGRAGTNLTAESLRK